MCYGEGVLRAIAIATDTSDVVGTLDLVCEEGGLWLHFVRASAHAVDYIPALALRGQKLLVPYEAIREVHDDGETLRLVLAAAKLPHRRLILTHFTRDLRQDATSLHRRRRRAQAAVAAASALLAGGLAAGARWLGALPSTLVTLTGAFLAVGGGVWFSQEIGRRVMLGGTETAAERRAFFSELNRRVARARGGARLVLDPATPVSAESPPLLEAPGPVPAPDAGPLAELYPTLAAVGVAALVALFAVSAGRSVLGPTAATPADPLPAGLAAPPPSAAAASPPAEEPLGLCMCQAPSSPYLPGRLPRLTVLPRIERRRDDPRRPSLSLEVAVVNNGAMPLREVKGNVDFLTPAAAPGGPPRVRAERGFYYEGPLLPGHAVKWHLSGRGSSYRIKHDFDELLAGDELAPADAFAELLHAKTRSVRVHGAMMLTRMRDERAARAIEELREGAPEAEQDMLRALARAAAPVYVCEIEQIREGNTLELAACAMNTTEEEIGPVDAVANVASEDTSAEPASLSRWVLRERVLLPPRTGVRIKGTLENALPSPRVEVLLEPHRK
jgi:hypothetical protein